MFQQPKYTKEEQQILDDNAEARQECECWCRTMGYYRPYSHYNIGKKSEFRERLEFSEKHMSCPCTRESEVLAA